MPGARISACNARARSPNALGIYLQGQLRCADGLSLLHYCTSKVVQASADNCVLFELLDPACISWANHGCTSLVEVHMLAGFNTQFIK
eukprot:scaffold50134_cov21-Tisochrysis_lutea.AAC.3